MATEEEKRELWISFVAGVALGIGIVAAFKIAGCTEHREPTPAPELVVEEELPPPPEHSVVVKKKPCKEQSR